MRLWLSVLSWFVLTASASAQAPDPVPDPAPDPAAARQKADRLVAEGAALGGEGRFEEAITHFKAAEAVFPRAIHQCNIGLAYVRLERWPQALFWLDRCKAGSAAAGAALPAWIDPRRKQLLDTLRAGAYVPVRIEVVPTGSTITISAFAADEILTPPADVWLPEGAHTVEARLEGYQPHRRALKLEGKNPLRVEIELEREVVEPVTPPAPAPEPAPEPSRGGGNTLAWGILGGGGALGVAGVIFYTSALGLRDEAARLPPGAAYNAKIDDFKTSRALAFTLGGVGIAAMGVGGYLLYAAMMDGEGAPDPAAAGVSVGPTGVVFRTGF